MASNNGCKVRVGVRVRPLTSQEIQQGGKNSLSVASPTIRLGERQFTFDSTFDSNVGQDDLYNDVSPPLLKSFADGYNATIMAYGQTGSGKTFTMGSEAHTGPEAPSHVGLIPRFITDFFQEMQRKKDDSDKGEEGSPVLVGYDVYASFLEVYGEDVFDLLDPNRKSLPLREDSNGGIVISGLKNRPISNLNEALQVLHEGTMNRTTAATLMNFTSSRSHAVFTIHLSQQIHSDQSNNVDISSNSKFTFVDLAGSERMKKTGAEGERAREGIKINEGLLALGNVINALADEEIISKDKKVHVPYRQSKLTRLLQDALGGNSQTLFLACVSPSDTNASETLSTLHYANRARNIRNAPTKNLDPASLELHRLQTLAHVLECELVKAKFPESRSPEEKIGYVDNAMMQREDVVGFIKSIYEAASERIDDGGATGPSHSFPPIESNSSHSRRQEASPNSETSFMEIDATPNGKSRERANNVPLEEVNPDEDLAILDRLLELQQHDQEFDINQKSNDDQIKRLNGDLQNEQALLLQLRQSLTMYQDLKTRYEDLMTEVQQLEGEKSELALQLEKAKTDPSAGSSTSIKRQLEKVELSLSRARRETLTHRQKYKDAEEQAKKCRVLERRVEELKHAKSTLVRKQKEASVRYKEVTETKTKELLVLRRKEKNSEMQLSKLQTEIQLHKTNLEKRKNYCAKLTEKMKQTEARLMKYLAVRQREITERASTFGSNNGMQSEESHESWSNNYTVSIEDQKQFKFVFDKMTTEKIMHAQLKEQLERHTSSYNDTMRNIVVKVKELSEAKAHQGEDGNGERNQCILDLEEIIADLELKLEILGSEMERIQSKLPEDYDKYASDGEKAAEKVLRKLSSQALRAGLRESFTKIVRSEIERQNQSDRIIRKDAALLSFENEVDQLNKKLESLANDLRNRRAVAEAGEDPVGAIARINSEKAILSENVRRLDHDLKTSNEKMGSLQSNLDKYQQELAETKDRLALAEVSKENQMDADEPRKALNEIHKIWDDLGVDSSLREETQKAIQDSVKDTCAAKLNEAKLLYESTEKEATELFQQLGSMQKSLGIAPDRENENHKLLNRCDWLRGEVEKLEMPCKYACTRHKNIVEAASELSLTLGIASGDLPENLRDLVKRSKGFDSSSVILGRRRRASAMKGVKMMVDALSQFEDENNVSFHDPLRRPSSLCQSTFPPEIGTDDIPIGILEEGLLERCEKEIASLRVQKSELLVHNREMQQEICGLLRDMHMSKEEIVDSVEQSLARSESGTPEWWDKEAAETALKRFVAHETQKSGLGADAPFLRQIFETGKRIADRRRTLCTKLLSLVERGQNGLLNIVGRELDVSEAYASFHSALVKLPPLSMDLNSACVAEMEALVLGVESMAQSEIEALTVVWEALNVSSKSRRDFWGRVENSVSSVCSGGSTSFDDFSSLEDEEECVADVVKQAKAYSEDLEKKLKKLGEIHDEVERLRSKQDTKSQILSLDSEIRLLNAKFTDFEETKCSKQRLLTKKSTGSHLLKEERFRKEMQSKFIVKLGQLSTLLRSWEAEERKPFESSLLSEDVRMLLAEPQNMEKWVEKRTKFMPLRTVQPSPAATPTSTSNPARKRTLQTRNDGTESSSKSHRESPFKKKTMRSTAKTLPRLRPRTKPNEQGGTRSSSELRSKRKATPQKTARSPQKSEEVPIGTIGSRSPIRRPPKRQRRKESSILPPFGNILGSPRP